jgi:hypothetical protein
MARLQALRGLDSVFGWTKTVIVQTIFREMVLPNRRTIVLCWDLALY